MLGYVRSCQNVDGGYAFCEGVDSNAQDTFCALSILRTLDAPPERAEMTVRWLESFPKEDIRSNYYVAYSLAFIKGNESISGLKSSAICRLSLDQLENSFSEFETIFMMCCLAKLQGKKLDSGAISTFLLQHQNNDGGFGYNKHSNLLATFQALYSLRNVGYNLNDVKNALEFTRACENRDGGFTSVPNTRLPFIEDTYSGVSILKLYGESARQPLLCGKQIMKSLRSNGGFSRADFGIPTLEYTFYAVRAMAKLNLL